MNKLIPAKDCRQRYMLRFSLMLASVTVYSVGKLSIFLFCFLTCKHENFRKQSLKSVNDKSEQELPEYIHC